MNGSGMNLKTLKKNGSASNDREDWISPHELKKQWRKKEFFRLSFLLLSSHLISFLLLVPTPPPMPPIKKGHILVQLQGCSLLKGISSSTPVSLFSETGHFLSHGHIMGYPEEHEHPQLLTLEIPSTKLPKILKWRSVGITVTPKTKRKKGGRIYEMDI